MARKEPKSTTLRRFLIERFVLIAVLIVVAVLILSTLEDFVFSGVIAFLADTRMGDSGSAVLRLGGLLLSDGLPGGDSLDVSALRKIVLMLLFILMVGILAVPVVIGATVFARIAEQRIVADQKAREEEQARLYQRRNLMISDMAHDLRTPVMAISGQAQALADGMVTDKETEQRYLHSIMAKSEKMADLVTMLFDFVKLDSEGYELDRVTLDLPQLVLQEAAAAYTDVEEAGMELRIEVPETPVPVFADKRQLARVVANLIANAVRHNSPGTTIVVGLNRRAGVVDIIVADTGRRIEGNAEELFEPFTREDTARSGGGSGLGLSIVKSIVDMHGYSIKLMQPYGAFTKAFIVTCSVEG